MIPAPLLVVTDRHGSNRPVAETVQAVLDGGARWIWFRDKDMEREARRALASELLALIRAAGGVLTIGGDAALAAEIGADGVHLGATQFHRLSHSRPHPEVPAPAGLEGGIQEAQRSPKPSFEAASQHLRMRLGSPPFAGVSAHGLDDVRRAVARGIEYATLSPIFPTSSKPGYGPALGLDGLREASATGIPIIALGGIDPTNARSCRDAGAAGVAVMGTIMRATDPAGQTRRFVEALDGAT